jgi:hypothetical protein
VVSYVYYVYRQMSLVSPTFIKILSRILEEYKLHVLFHNRWRLVWSLYRFQERERVNDRYVRFNQIMDICDVWRNSEYVMSIR